MVSHPTNEFLWHLLSRLTPESRRFFLHSLGAGKRLSHKFGPSSPAKQEGGKLLAWHRPRGAQAACLTSERLAEIQQQAAEYENERLAAPGLAEELLTLPPEQRGKAVGGEERFRTLALAEQLLWKSRKLSFQNPRRGRKVAELSLEIVQSLDAHRYGSQVVQDFCGRAWSEIANACRLGADLAEAERALLKARACIDSSSDPLERARLYNLEAALRKEQRQFEEAFQLRDRAVAIYRRFQDLHSVGRTLNSKGSDFLEMGRPEKAMECLQAAIELLDPTIEPRITLAAYHNLTLALAEQGRFGEAAKALAGSQDLFAQADSDLRTKRDWVRGRIALGLGQLEEAERILHTVRREFRRRDIPYEYAASTLDLAFVCLRQGRTADVKRLASEMMPIFESGQIHREALAVLTLFRQAVERETLTVESLRKIIVRLGKTPRGA